MLHRRLLIATFAVLMLWASPPESGWQELRRRVNAGMGTGQFAEVREALKELKPLMPGNARNAYLRAVVESQLGNTAGALQELTAWSEMGLVADLAAEPRFRPLRALPAFDTILRQVEKNRLPISSSTLAFTLAEPDLIPEDLAWDGRTKRFFISSVRLSKIVTGDGREFAQTPWSAFALRADPKRRLLWATTAWSPVCAACDPADKGRSALLAFHLDSGRLLRRVESPLPGTLSDMTLSKDGDLYVSDSTAGALFRVRSGSGTFERLDVPGDFPSPQTPALSPDEKTLYVPDYLRGLAAINLKTKVVTWVQPAGNLALSGIDGLYSHGGAFLLIRNGTNPPGILRFPGKLDSGQVLEANWVGLGEPTHGTLVGNQFFFIANTGWPEYDEQGRRGPGAPVISTVRSIRLR